MRLKPMAVVATSAGYSEQSNLVADLFATCEPGLQPDKFYNHL